MAHLIDKDALIEYINFRYLGHQTGNQPIGCLDKMNENKEILSYLNFEPTERFSEYEEYMNVDLINWLKSLKERYTWKTSDEQMIALKESCDEHWEPDGLDPLYTLYQDLKKLIK